MSLGWIQLTFAVIDDLWELDCAGKALTPKAAAQETSRNLEVRLENILKVVLDECGLVDTERDCDFDVLMRVLMLGNQEVFCIGG